MLALANQLPPPQVQQPSPEPGNTGPPSREAVLAQITAMLWRGALAE
jgi:hypothetical protein